MNSARKDLFEKIINVYPNLSPKKRRVADLIIKDYKKIFLMTAREIARECDISEPTIIRFVNDLGFSGYIEFVQYMKGLLHMELTAVERLTKASRQSDERNALEKYCQNANQNIENLKSSISPREMRQIAKILHKAERVYVVGYRASAALVYFFGYLLKKIRDEVMLDTNLAWEVRDAIARDGRHSVMFAIAFPRYVRKTIEVVRIAKNSGVKIIALSDTPKSPIIGLADQYVLIDLESVSFIDPFAHVMVYLSALVHEITFIDNAKAMKYLANFDSSAKISNEFYTENDLNGKN